MRKRKNIKGQIIFLTIIFLILSIKGFAQKKDAHFNEIKLIQTDQIEFVNSIGPESDFIPCFGNVVFQHYNLLFKCDSALFSMKSNIIIGYGKTQILRNDSLLFTPLQFKYFGNTDTLMIDERKIDLKNEIKK